MASVEIPLRGLGRLGIVTDEDPHRIDNRMLAAAENMVLRNGVPAAIGRLPTVAAPGSGDTYRSVIRELGVARRLIAYTGNLGAGIPGLVDITNAGEQALGAVAGLGPADDALPLVEYENETLWFPQNATSPIFRWSGTAASLFSHSTGVSVGQGNKIATWTTTNYPGAGAFGVYLETRSNTEAAPRCIRLVRTGNLFAEMEHQYTGVASPVSVIIGPVGLLGLSAPVRLVAGTYAAPNVTLTANTVFTDAIQGAGITRVSDYIGAQVAASEVALIDSLTNTTAVLGAGSLAAGPARYQVMRPMPGTCGALHKGRLYTAGVAWMRNALFIFPQGYRFSDIYNGIDSPVTDLTRARMAKFIHIPDPNAVGRITAVMSTPSYLLVLRDRDVYALSGEYPTNSVNLLWAQDGCIDVRSAIQTRYGQVWAGRHGVYLHDRGGISNLTEGRRQQEWRNRIEAITDSSGAGPAHYVTCAVAGRHLLVSTLRTTTSPSTDHETWVYDLDARAWVGNIPNLRARHFSPNGASPSLATGTPDTLTWTDPVTGGVGEYEESSLDDPSGVVEGLSIETGALAGLGENDKITNLKVDYELEGPAPGPSGDPGITFSTRIGAGAEAVLIDNISIGGGAESSGAPRSIRLRNTGSFIDPNTTLRTIAAEGNAVRLAIDSTGNPTKVRIHGVRVIVRKRGRRA